MFSKPLPPADTPPMDMDDQRALRERALRRMALRVQPATTSRTSREAEQTAVRTERMLHELEVRKLELAMQNEALRNARADEASALRCFADLFEHAPVGYITLDHEGRIAIANLMAAALLGDTPAALAGKSLASCVADASRPALRDTLTAAAAPPCTAACEVTLHRDATLTLRMEVRADPGSNSLLMALIDLSAIKRSEAAEHELHRLRERERLRSELLSRFSHDLRTPLNAINGFAELLLDGSLPLAGTEQRRMAQHILDAGRQLLLQVERVLALPR